MADGQDAGEPKAIVPLAAPSAPPPPEEPDRESEVLTLEQARRLLAPYLEANPLSNVADVSDDGTPFVVVERPWGDDSLAIVLAKYDRLVDSLNNVFLPERYTAIYHRDTADIEFIWTAHPLPPHWKDLETRSFSFRYHGREYRCEFGPSSSRLLMIATCARPIAASPTNHRNLQSFNRWAHEKANAKISKKDGAEASSVPGALGRPMSFWVRGVEWDDEEVLSLASHLNFYMTYYDTRTCSIHIHQPAPKSDGIKPQTRYAADKFPSGIVGREIDQNLLHFWMAARDNADEARRFQLYYRIIEYASNLYLESDARKNIHKILGSPHAWSEIDKTTGKIWSVVQPIALDEYQRFQHLIEETLGAEMLWREIKRNLPAFDSETTFDGGYVAAALVKTPWELADFKKHGMAAFASAIRRMRNALTHGRDEKTQTVITPTARNLHLLRPWVSLIAVAAGEIMINRDLS